MNKDTRQFNQAQGLPPNYSNSLRFLDMMYRDPVFKRNTINQPKHRDIFDTIRQPNQTTIQQINNTTSSAATYDLPKFKKLRNPLSKKSIVLHLILGLIATIILGLVLTVVFGEQNNFSVLDIVRNFFGYLSNISYTLTQRHT
ncbi:MAG: hypothetical protein LBK70_01405 [Clostridiales bacterium]|jgi:hypothetical protein|nr:hypothetical protein [Clostridiales bacterium]